MKLVGWCNYFSPIKLVSLRKLAPSRNLVCTGTSSLNRNDMDFVTEISFCKNPVVDKKRKLTRVESQPGKSFKVSVLKLRRRTHFHNRWLLLVLIVSITKFSIVIGSPRAYLARNRRAITWVSNYRCPIWTFSNRTPVIGYQRDFHVNYARFNGFLSKVFYSFQNFGKVLRTFSLKRSS